MLNKLNIKYLFASLDDISQRIGARMARLLRRLARKYAALGRCCSREQMLLAVSLAWGLSAEAENGNVGAFLHIDQAMHLCQNFDRYAIPADGMLGAIVVEGNPFYFREDDEMDGVMEHFLWDSFALMLECSEKAGEIGQYFYDVADRHQWKAYEVVSENADMSVEVERSVSPLGINIVVNNYFEGDFYNHGTLTGNYLELTEQLKKLLGL